MKRENLGSWKFNIGIDKLEVEMEGLENLSKEDKTWFGKFVMYGIAKTSDLIKEEFKYRIKAAKISVEFEPYKPEPVGPTGVS